MKSWMSATLRPTCGLTAVKLAGTRAPLALALVMASASLRGEAQSVACNVQRPSTCWTIESTGSKQSGPWLRYSEPGTRFYRHPGGDIFRVYPPGLKPSAIPVHPDIVKLSTESVRGMLGDSSSTRVKPRGAAR